ncbi:hypothetical protein FOC1_g10001078 [Fusarium oxysporum f. sp. cubense race 1]|uniref:Uncharacterized protein n=1 Tax=Fusarium oxysporum f. sp. cubense (strain race 1) TaxID=1229664 RepID=N4UTD0_FUSC1|nr:hypothetical protein FOC1_g10001078 [Fusarium oxysporum f. sp. cubense race 1]
MSATYGSPRSHAGVTPQDAPRTATSIVPLILSGTLYYTIDSRVENDDARPSAGTI